MSAENPLSGEESHSRSPEHERGSDLRSSAGALRGYRGPDRPTGRPGDPPPPVGTTTFLERLGLTSREPELDQLLMDYVYAFLSDSQVGYEQFFFDWYGGLASDSRAAESPEAATYTRDSFTKVRAQMEGYLPAHPDRLAHPYFRGLRPCTLLIDGIEALWTAIAERDDWSLFHAKLDEIAGMRAALVGP